MKCSRCQFENRAGIRFCEECGVKLDLTCPACAARVPADRKFCGSCGQTLVAKSTPAPTVVPEVYTPASVAEDCALFVGTAVRDERGLKRQVWNHLKKFGDAGTTPRRFALDLLGRGWARGNADACAARVRELLESMLDLPGYERTEKLSGGRYRAINLREDQIDWKD